MRPGALFAFLAARAEHGGDDDDKKAALHNLHTLAPFKRMVLAGMMADLTWEHRKAVIWSDDRDPDPSEIVAQLEGFLYRIQVLIGGGMIFSAEMTHTFTAQIIKFYREPKILQVKKYAHWLSLPAKREEFFEPLERMRAIVGNIEAALAAAFPENCWHHTFKAFKLPSPCANTQAERPRLPLGASEPGLTGRALLSQA